MKRLSAIILGVAMTMTPLTSAAAVCSAPVNPDATAEAVRLYDFLRMNYGHRIISGAVSQSCHDTRMAEYIYGVTGKYPAINCFDFMEHIQCAPLNPSGWSRADYQNTAIDREWVGNGGIISYHWHWNVPRSSSDINDFNRYAFYCNGAGGESDTDFSVAEALRPGTWQNNIINRDIDIIAGYFLALQDQDIAVLWRPLHEAAGNTNSYNGGKAWVWWGNSGSDNFRRLWIYMFDRMKAKGVNNLLWVWTSCGNDADWYPGDAYVDIIGTDYYENNPALFHSSVRDRMDFLSGISSEKILALTETGALPSVENMLAAGDLWSYAVPWTGDFTTDAKYNSAEFLRSQYASEYMITRENTFGDSPEPDFNTTVLWSGAAIRLDWSSVQAEVSPAESMNIAAGDILRITVSHISDDSGIWPKALLRCSDGWTQIACVELWDSRGMSLPATFDIFVTSGMLPELRKGFFLGGEGCSVTRLEHIGNAVVSDCVETVAAETSLADVYSLQGICVRRGAERDKALEGLPSGIYIINGKKYMKK